VACILRVFLVRADVGRLGDTCDMMDHPRLVLPFLLSLAALLSCGDELGVDGASIVANDIPQGEVSFEDGGATFEDAGAVDASATADASTSADAAGSPQLANLSAEELDARLASKDFLLVNVASASGNQIPQTDTYIQYSDTAALVDFIGPDLDTEVVLYCNSGGRSGVAGGNLVELGYSHVSHLAGGKNAWVEAGYALVDPS